MLSDTAEPALEFAGQTPYEQYVHASVLHSLQHPRSGDPGEMAFLVITQIMELYFGLLCHEWRTARDAMAEDDLDTAMAALRRSSNHLRGLNASWDSLARLTPAEFNRFRPDLGEGSGFQSAMYRKMEFLLGEKSAALINPHRGVPQVAADLAATLDEPSLYDAALGLLARRGLPIPEHVLHRDRTISHSADPDVEQAWAGVYTDPLANKELFDLGEALTDIAEEFGRWRYIHLIATRRAMGAKVGTGGSAGVAWLAKRADHQLFPDLWNARSYV